MNNSLTWADGSRRLPNVMGVFRPLADLQRSEFAPNFTNPRNKTVTITPTPATKDFVVDASAWARSMWARVFPPEN